MADIFPKLTFTTCNLFAFQFVAWLVNDQTSTNVGTPAWITSQGGTGGPGWEIYCAYSVSSSTFPRQNHSGAPLTGNGALDSFTDAVNFGWANGTVITGDWIVLRCLGANPFEVYIEVQSNTEINYKLMPLASKQASDAFNSAGATASTPPPASDFPATALPSGATTTFNVQTAPAASSVYSGVGDPRMFALIMDDATNNVSFMYIGAVTGVGTEDPYPFVIYEDDLQCRWELTDASAWRRISPVDETTELTTMGNTQMYSQGPADRIQRDDTGAATGQTNLIPIGVDCTQAGHQHFVGWLENVYSVPATLGSSGSINVPQEVGTVNYIFRNNDTAAPPTADPGMGMLWDGKTTFP